MTSQCFRRCLRLCFILVTTLCVRAETNYPTPYHFTTLAGESSVGHADGLGSAARFWSPGPLLPLPDGSIYVTDGGNHTLRRASLAGVVTTVLGETGFGIPYVEFGSPLFMTPRSLVIDATGTLYLADSSAIRKVAPDGTLSPFVGNSNSRVDIDGDAASAQFSSLRTLTLDRAGNFYAISSAAIRKITPAGVVSTLAGKSGEWSYVDGPGPAARFVVLTGLVCDASGSLYAIDRGVHVIRKITPDGTVSTFAGRPTPIDQYFGTHADGPASEARFYLPEEMAIDAQGNLYVGDIFTIRKVTPDGNVTTIAGAPGESGAVDGTGAAARFARITGLAVAANGDLFVADGDSNTLRRVTPAGVVTTLAGLSPIQATGSADGTGRAARFSDAIGGVAVGSSGNVYVADAGNQTIRKITSGGIVTTLAGSVGNSGSTDGTGSTARFDLPQGIAVDHEENVYVADTRNFTIRKITPAGLVTTLAGSPGRPGAGNGTGSEARFNNPYGIAVDATGNIFVSDIIYWPDYTWYYEVTRKISPAGVVTRVADITIPAGYSSYLGPGLALDPTGNIYRFYRAALARISPTGEKMILAGDEIIRGFDDGTGYEALFLSPNGLAADAGGNIYVTDANTIRKITPAGAVSTLAGLPTAQGFANGLGNEARFVRPRWLAVDLPGNLYVPSGSTIRKGQLAGPPAITTQPQSQSVPAGSNVQFSVTAMAVPGPDYQWYFNGTPFSGAKTNTLSFPNARSSDAGDYTVVVTNSLGSVTSAKATLTITITPVTPPPPPASSGGGGGAPSTPFLLVLCALVLARRLVARRKVSPLARFCPHHAGPDGTRHTISTFVAAGPHSELSVPAIVHWLLFLALAACSWAQANYQTPYSFTTLAGESSVGSADGTGNTARFFGPSGVALDPAGNLYVADAYNSTIRKITPAGVVSTHAGKAGLVGNIDGNSDVARFNRPHGLAFDLAGNLYVTDSFNSTIRKITPAGVVTTIAGAAGIDGSTDGTGGDARFSVPRGIAVDAGGNLYVADSNNFTIRKITSAGVVTTLAGTAGSMGDTDGTGGDARFNQPEGLVADRGGNIYVADTGNHTIRKITPAGVVTTFAGMAGFLSGGWSDGTGGAARFNGPLGIGIDPAGNLYVADINNDTIRKITPVGAVTTLAGSAYSSGDADGPGSAARFSGPVGIAVDSAGNVYVGDSFNHTIRRIDSSGAVSTMAGLPPSRSTGRADATGRAARFSAGIGGVTVAPSGDIYITDTGNHTIRKITQEGVVTTFAGAAGVSGDADGVGPAARFSSPMGISIDGSGMLYVADSANHRIRKIDPTGLVSTPTLTGTMAHFTFPQDIAIDPGGTLFVTTDDTIRKINPVGAVANFAGNPDHSGSADGTGSEARFSAPTGIVIDPAGNLYVADTYNSTIRKVTPARETTTFAGLVSPYLGARRNPGMRDGPGSDARFYGPGGMAIDPAGNLYVADTANKVIRMITPARTVTTLAGRSEATGLTDGLGNEARFVNPCGVELDSAGNIYVVDGSTIRKGQLAGPPTITAQPQSLVVSAGGSVQFSVTAAAVPAPTYQWYLNDSPFSGATNQTLSFTNTRSADAGTYTVVVTNSLGSVTSAKATLTVTVAPVTPPPPAPSGGGGGGAPSAWFFLVLSAAAGVRFARALRRAADSAAR